MTYAENSPPAEDDQGAAAAANRLLDKPKHTPCTCPDSELLWLILSGEAPPPDTAGWRSLLHFVEALMLRRLAEARPILLQSDLDAIIPNRFAALEVLRNTYATPARTAAQLLAEARASWDAAERDIASRLREAS